MDADILVVDIESLPRLIFFFFIFLTYLFLHLPLICWKLLGEYKFVPFKLVRNVPLIEDKSRHYKTCFGGSSHCYDAHNVPKESQNEFDGLARSHYFRFRIYQVQIYKGMI